MASAPETETADASAAVVKLGCSAGCSARCRREWGGGAPSAVAAPPATKSRPLADGLPGLGALALWWG